MYFKVIMFNSACLSFLVQATLLKDMSVCLILYIDTPDPKSSLEQCGYSRHKETGGDYFAESDAIVTNTHSRLQD